MSIINPKTGRQITINGATHKKLIKEGYFIKQRLPDEIIEEILMHGDGVDLMAICNSNKKFKKICDNESFWKKMVYKYYADSGLLTLNKPFSEIFKIAYHLSILQKTSLAGNDTLLDWYEYDDLTIHQEWPEKMLDALYYMNGLEELTFHVKDLTDLQLLKHIPPNLKDIKYHLI